MLRKISVLFISVFALIISGCASTKADQEATNDYSASIKKSEEFLKNQDFTGTVLIAKEGEILFANGYGLSDSKNPASEPVTINSNLEIGSISKQFASSAIMQLVEKGLMSVEDKMSKYFPDYIYGDQITLKNLLTMRSGISSGIYSNQELLTEGFALINEGKSLDNAFWVSYLNKYPLEKEPGTKFNYNNLNYLLLAKIVEQVSGQNYADYVQENLFEPCGMTHSNMEQGNVDMEAYDFKGEKQHLPADYMLGCGDINSNVVDLFKWVRGILGGKVVSQESLLEMTFNRAADSREYGYGFFYDGSKIYHTGETLTYNSILIYDFETKMTCIVLCNRTSTMKSAMTISSVLGTFWK